MFISDRYLGVVMLIFGFALGYFGYSTLKSVPYGLFIGGMWVIQGLFYLVRGYPVSVPLLKGRKEEREAIKKWYRACKKWLDEHPE